MSFVNIVTEYDLLIVYFLLVIFDYYVSAYLFCKVQNICLNKKQFIYVIISGLILSIGFIVFRNYSQQMAQLLLFAFIPFLLVFIGRTSWYSSIAIGLISFSVFRVSRIIATIITATVFWFFGHAQEDILVYFTELVCASVLCYFLMRIKRFKKGFQFFLNDKHFGLGLALTGVILTLTCVNLEALNEMDIIYVIVIIGVLISGFGLYLWIRHSITARYREHLQSQSEEQYQKELSKRDREIEKQRQSNEYLAKVVHRDNHLMNSLNTAIDAYYNTNDNAEKSDLFREIQTMIKERGELIDREQRETKLLPSTGSLLIDSTINDLYIKAAAHGIDFDMAASVPVSEIIGKYISQTALQTLLSDHIKDAVIAVEAKGEESGKILLDLSMQNDNYCITIYDNGVAFEIDTLSKLGRERVTTYADSGGSGIGFMTTFETLNKAYASLIITEFDSTMPFTKSVAFRFDGESSFIIQSHRSEELKEKLTRDDVVIL